MKTIKLYFLLLLFPIVSFQCSSSISNYKVVFGIFTKDGKETPNLVLRSYKDDNDLMFFCVNPETLQTILIKNSEGSYTPMSWEKIKEQFKATPYIKAIAMASVNASKLQDAGVTHTLPNERGINLTIDLCPSKKKLDKRIFTTIIEEFNQIETPTPLAISVSGIWMNKHKADLEWIKKQIQDGKIKVDWINHSYSHRYNKDNPLKDNFMLEKGTDMNYEILQNEIAMIENGLTPSAMFRFPGLVSDKSIFAKVTDYGLIPIGTDAWLAKNQKAKDGSIVLIHGNGNEPLGVEDFITLIRSERENIKNKNWMLFDLSESLRNEKK